MESLRGRIKSVVSNLLEEFLPFCKDENFEENGAVYYMNGDDGTVFDWGVNDRLCEFMVFYEKTKKGAVKLNIKKDGSAIAYIYDCEGKNLSKETRFTLCAKDEALSLAVLLFNVADKEKKYDSNIDKMDFAHEVTDEEKREFLSIVGEEREDEKKITPADVRSKIEGLFKEQGVLEENDKIVIEEEEGNVFYGCLISNEYENFEQIIVDGNDLSFLWDGSAMPQKELLEIFKDGARSVRPRNKRTRRNVLLPVINDDKEILSFAKKMAETFMNLFEIRDFNEKYPLKDEWYNMIYNGVVLLLSAKEANTQLIILTHVYHSPALVRSYLKKVMDKDVYDYWTKKVPSFMGREDSGRLIDYFDFTIASLIGEQEIQDLCNNYKESQEAKIASKDAK